MRVILIADEEAFEDLLDARQDVQHALTDAGFDISAVGVMEDE